MKAEEIVKRKEIWVVLAILVAFAGIVISRIGPSDEGGRRVRNSTGVIVERGEEDIYRLGNPGDYSYISSRNLFKPLVEPPKQEQPKVEEPKKEEKPKPLPPDPASDLILTGIINMPDGKRAVIENRQGTEGHYVRQGDLVRGMKVIEIGENSVALEKADGGRTELRLGAGQKIIKAEAQTPREQQPVTAPPSFPPSGPPPQFQIGGEVAGQGQIQRRLRQPLNVDELMRRMRERGMSEEEIRDRIQRFMERRGRGGEGGAEVTPIMPVPR